MNQAFKTAHEVSEYLLEKTGRAILRNEVEAILPYFLVPAEIQTFDGRRILRTRADICRLFDAVSAHYHAIGVTDMARHCVEASFTDPKTVVAMHETRLITGSLIKRDPFPTLSVLKLDGQQWKIASCSYAIKDQEEHNSALMSAGAAFPSE
ncbi:MAG: hypothetical protein AB8B62_19935 [Roseobacter sp.]